MLVKLEQIFRFPVKSCAGEECKTADLAQGRILGDRDWSIVKTTDNGFEIITQREDPRLSMIQPHITDQGLTLTIKNHATLEVPISTNQEVSIQRIRKKLLGRDPVALEKPAKAYDQGDDAAEYLTNFLGYPCRLVYQDPKKINDQDLTDQGAISVLTRESWEALSKALHARGQACPPIINFRPNSVIASDDNSQEAFFEDGISVIKPGHQKDLELRRTGATTRCFMPEIDPATGTQDYRYREYMKALMELRGTQTPILGSFLRLIKTVV